MVVIRVVGDDFGPAVYLVSLLLLYEMEGFGTPYLGLCFLNRQKVYNKVMLLIGSMKLLIKNSQLYIICERAKRETLSGLNNENWRYVICMYI